MAVSTADTGCMHAALRERTIDIDLIHDLSVREVEPVGQHGRRMEVQKGLAGHVAVSDDASSRVTLSADLYVVARPGQAVGRGDALTGRTQPRDLLERHRQCGSRIFRVSRPWAMARFAVHAGIRP